MMNIKINNYDVDDDDVGEMSNHRLSIQKGMKEIMKRYETT